MASPLSIAALLLAFLSLSSPALARLRHTNFHTELERQYELGLRKRPVTSGEVQTLTITQPLDHFDRLNNATYEQTYWVNEQFWSGTAGSPVFLYLGGEWEESGGTLEYGSNVMSVWAKTFGGLMVDIQHRYYNGVPAVEDGNPAGIEYLSSEQAIADVAAVVAHLNSFYAVNRSATGLKWIHMGGSYAGNMAAYYRLKYPHLSVGAFAISGPVEAVVDYTGFFSVEGHDLTPACLNSTRAAVRVLDALVADQVKGWPQILADFNVTFVDPVLDTAVWGFELTWGLLSTGRVCRSVGDSPYEQLVRAWDDSYGVWQFNARYDANAVWQTAYGFLWYYQTCVRQHSLVSHSLTLPQPSPAASLVLPCSLTPPSCCAVCRLRPSSASIRPAPTSTATLCKSHPSFSPHPTSLPRASECTTCRRAQYRPSSTSPMRCTAVRISLPATHSSHTAMQTGGVRLASRTPIVRCRWWAIR